MVIAGPTDFRSAPTACNRNPIYQAVGNPDRSLRRGDIQYIVWDAFSARRSAHFERRLLSYVARYRGRAVYTFSTLAHAKDGSSVRVPLIIVYAVQPMKRWLIASLRVARSHGGSGGGRGHDADDADPSHRRSDAGEPLVRQLLRNLPGRRWPTRGDVPAAEPRRTRLSAASGQDT